MLGPSHSTPALRLPNPLKAGRAQSPPAESVRPVEGSSKRLPAARARSGSPRAADPSASPRGGDDKRSMAGMDEKERARFGFIGRLSNSPARSPRSTPSIAARIHDMKTAYPRLAGASDISSAPRPLSLNAHNDLTALIESLLVEEDSVRVLLRTKLLAGKFDYKARLEELTELTEALKGALFRQLANTKEVVASFVPVQAQINTRLAVVAEEAATYRAAEQVLSAELAVAQDQAKSHDLRINELRESLAEARQERAAALDECTQRMESLRKACKAEAAQAAVEYEQHILSLEEREKSAGAKLVTAGERENELLAEIANKEQALREFASESQMLQQEKLEAIRRLERQLAQSETRLQDTVADLQLLHKTCADKDTEFESQLRERDRKARKVEAAMMEKQAERDAEFESRLREKDIQAQQVEAEMVEQQNDLMESHAAILEAYKEEAAQALLGHELEKDVLSKHILSSEEREKYAEAKLVEAGAREKELLVIRCDLEATLRDFEEVVKQKDAHIRESLQSFNQIHGDSHKQLFEERQSVQQLEMELQKVQMSEADLQGSLKESAQIIAQLDADVASFQESVSSEREKLSRCEYLYSLQQKELSHFQTKLEQNQKEKTLLEADFARFQENHTSVESLRDLKLTVERLTKLGERPRRGGFSGSMENDYTRDLEQRLSVAEQSRREAHNALQDLKGSIRVFCRIRPGLEGNRIALEPDQGDQLSLICGGDIYNFSFDRVFDAPSTQEAVFAEVSGLVQSALDGYKVCIFAYGQTGSGKTYTMQGPDPSSEAGLIPRSLHQIFDSSRAMMKQGWTWSLQVSFLEVYNETFRDLLQTGRSPIEMPPVHTVKHDEVWGSMVTNMTIVDVESMQQVEELMAVAARQRSVGATDSNAVSSRSHAVFALYLKGTNVKLNSELHGALHLVDLAGSERLDKSGSTGDRLKEAQNINRSLFCLVDVFLAKSERRSHVPFRNSKLTHLMEPCLSGQGKTLMVVNAGPEESNAPETLCSLRFASQVNQCNTGGKAKRHVKNLRECASSPTFSPSPRHRSPLRSPRNDSSSVTRMVSAPRSSPSRRLSQ